MHFARQLSITIGNKGTIKFSQKFNQAGQLKLTMSIWQSGSERWKMWELKKHPIGFADLLAKHPFIYPSE
jgi:hypothetical protein